MSTLAACWWRWGVISWTPNPSCVRIAQCVLLTTSAPSWCLVGAACPWNRVDFCPAVWSHREMNRNRKPILRHRCLRLLLTLAILVLPASTLVAQMLPAMPASSEQQNRLSRTMQLFVRAFRFEGNHAFTEAELS